jgi:hypothetical protein
MYRQVMFVSIGIVYSIVVLMGVFVAEDTYIYNMLSDSDCFTTQHVQYEDGSCSRVDRGV